jgi:RNA-directed DNA polymerase
MEKLYAEGVAIHGGPESCVGAREGAGEALTGARVGRAIEPRNKQFGVPTPFRWLEGNTASGVMRGAGSAPRGQRTMACTEPPSARTGRSHCSPVRFFTGRAARGTPRR